MLYWLGSEKHDDDITESDDDDKQEYDGPAAVASRPSATKVSKKSIAGVNTGNKKGKGKKKLLLSSIL
jgi:hypothetical protein